MNIKIPTLIIDRKKVYRNIRNMQSKLLETNTILRPHFKTHQLIEIGHIFKQQGINMITVSSVSMAMKFANNGWNNITIAFPVNILEIEEINNLAGSITLNLLVESVESLTFLTKELKNFVGIFVKIDSGYNRTGLISEDPQIDAIVNQVSKNSLLKFEGFLTHAGHTYNAKGQGEILNILQNSNDMLTHLKQKYVTDFPDIKISYGDTPSCSLANNFDGFDEIRPGNFVYYDVMQYHIGSCSLEEIAVSVACPVVAKHNSRNEIVVYGGAVHLTKENIEADNNFKLYGYIVNYTEDGWTEPIPGAFVYSLSQEHGLIKLPDKYMNNINIGDVVGILPIHSCLCANLLNDDYKIIN
jgi:D-serine deaminase-like pyridoxal phosphate-dependent protein